MHLIVGMTNQKSAIIPTFLNIQRSDIFDACRDFGNFHTQLSGCNLQRYEKFCIFASKSRDSNLESIFNMLKLLAL
jgi:hypothetical protein